MRRPRNHDLHDLHELDPAVARELEALDAALAGRPVDAELAEVAELARELHAARPEPSGEWADELDRLVAKGFEPGGDAGLDGSRPHPGAWLRRQLDRLRSVPPMRVGLAAGAVATCMIVVAAAVSTMDLSGSGGDDSGTSPTFTAEPGTATDAAPAPDGAASSAEAGGSDDAGRASDTGPYAADAGKRITAGTATITLGARPEEVQDVADEIVSVVDAHEGIVMSSDVQDGPEGEAGATFRLMVPSREVEDTIAELSAVADLRSREQSIEDITAPTLTTRDELREARAEVESLLGEVAQASGEQERAAVREELAEARRKAARIETRMNALQRRASLTPVDVYVETGGDGSASAEDDSSWGIGDAMGDAGRVLGTAAGITLIALAVLAPVALLALAALLVRAAWVRADRRRALSTRD